MTLRALRLAFAATLTFAFILPTAAAAQLTLTLRQGKGWVESNDLGLSRPGTNVTLRDVTWRDESYRSPIYYGLGLTWWLPRHREWGVGLDLTHAKAILETEETALAQGTVDGRRVDEPVLVRDVVPALQLSHGLNLATINGYRRWWAAPRVDAPTGVALY